MPLGVMFAFWAHLKTVPVNAKFVKWLRLLKGFGQVKLKLKVGCLPLNLSQTRSCVVGNRLG